MTEQSIWHNPATYTCIVAAVALAVSFLGYITARAALNFQKKLHTRQTMVLLANRCNEALSGSGFPQTVNGTSTIITTMCVAGHISDNDLEDAADAKNTREFFWHLLHSSIWSEIENQETLERIDDNTINSTFDERRVLKEQYETAKKYYKS
ncbi:hypothetical protein ACEPNH_000777 [Citrobacter freundii]|nr:MULTISPECIES: hypothetical protein [Citrobacter]EIX7372509.1 hypothetical protein [Citrobacter freundii]EKU2551708.1 hypothetical protein [Citrobacter freundii]KKC28310.1 hypothetical protein TO64_28840 [Citrobacter freundii]MBJ9854537.1 hypothetical protein [Citrobacter freundii]MBM7196290.1 hypothetical protein [Citrobacter freundii]